ncbi:hypothetical protein D3C80_1990460 [compost metagenome]
MISKSPSSLRLKTRLLQLCTWELSGTFSSNSVCPFSSSCSGTSGIGGLIFCGLCRVLARSLRICATASGAMPVTLPSSATPSTRMPPRWLRKAQMVS